MVKIKKVVLISVYTIIILFCCWLAFIWPTLKVTFDGSLYYKEKDFREYYLLTPELYKNMPRISENYDFYFKNVSGPAFLVWGVRFYGVTNAGPIEEYLKNQGWKLQKNCHVDAECWLKEGVSEELTLAKSDWEKRIELQLEANRYIRTYEE